MTALERIQLYLEYLPDALLSTDTAGRYAAYKIALEAGFLTLDEVGRTGLYPERETPEFARRRFRVVWRVA